MEKSRCRQFQANLFNKTRCQQCFKLKEQHSVEALENNKIIRKTTKCGFLYVAPDNLDFTNQSQKTKRWQRRWFILYDDGELTFALDQHPDTVPQGIVDMTECRGVSCAEEITQNPHSIRVSLPSKDYYFKADTAEEIKWWDDIFNMYVRQFKQNPASKRVSAPARIEATTYESLEAQNSGGCVATLRDIPVVRRAAVFSDNESTPESKTAAKQSPRRRVSDPLTQMNRVDGVVRTESFHGTPRSVKHRKSAKVRGGEFIDGMEPINFTTESPVTNMKISTTVKAPVPRVKLNKTSSSESEEEKDENISKVMIRKNKPDTSWISSVGVNNTSNVGGTVISVRSTPPSVRHRVGAENLLINPTRAKLEATFSNSSNGSAKSESHRSDRFSPLMTKDLFDQPSVDTNMHTLRKGWLSLRKSDNEWVKHWVVLSGLSLKLYKDSWAEEGGKSLLSIDLSNCEAVDPITVTRNYGIEIKGKKSRYVLSAMTPGIRDSWIGAIQQNLSNPLAISPHSDNSVEPNRSKETVKRRRIAYVPPARHGRRSSSAGTSSDEDIDEVETTSVFSRSSVELERSENLSDDETSLHQSNRAATPIALTPINLPSERLIEEAIRQRDEGRHRSVSPTTVRRSPVSRVKERDFDRRNHTGNHSRQNSDSLIIDPLPSPSRTESFDQQHNNHVRSNNKANKEAQQLLLVNSNGENGVSDSQQLVETLSAEVAALRSELEATKERLSKTDQDNQRLKDLQKLLQLTSTPGTSVSSCSDGSSSTSDVVGQLKSHLTGDRKEIEELREKLNESVEEMSETESALTLSLRDLSNAGAKMDKSATDEWNSKLRQMEIQLETTTKRLELAERELKERNIYTQELEKLREKEAEYLEEIRALRAKLISTESELELSLVRDTERRLNEQNSVRELKAQLALSRETVENLVKRIGHLEAIGTATPTVAECDEEISVMKNDESKVPNFQVEVETTRVLLRFFRSHSSFLLTQLQSSLDNVRWFHQTSASHTTIVARLKDAKAEVNSLLKNIDQLEQQCNSSAADNNSSHLPDEACRLIEQIEQTDSHVSSVVQEYLAKFRVRVNEVDQFESDKESPLDAACDSVQCVAATTPTVVLTSTQDCSSQTTSTDDMLGSLCPSRLHASLSANLSVCLVEKQSGYEDSTTYAPLELDSMLESYAGRMAYEIALLAEVTNLLESSKDQLTFKSALLLREIQSGFNSILKIGQLVSGPSDQNSLTTILTPDYVNNIGRRITAFMLDLWRTSLMENKELSEAVERVKGQPEILQKLLSCLTPSIQPAGQFAMLKRRLMDMEVDDFLQRVENSQSFERISHERTHQLIEGCLKSYEDCAESLTNELEQLINAEEGEDEELVELSCYVDKFSTVFCPNMEWSPRHFHIFETLKKLAEAQRANLPSTRAYLMCLKAVVNGISSHLQQLVEDSANISGNQTELIAENLRQTTLEKSKISPVDQLTWRHGPQSQNFVLNAILDVQNSLTVAVMSASHQVELSKLRKNLISSNTATHPVILRRPKVVRNSNDEWKRHSANLDAISEDMSGEVDMLRRQLATVEMKLEREQRRLKDEVDYWQREAQLRADTNLTNEIRDLEQELVEIQNAHTEELEALRGSHQQSLQHLQSRLATEVEMRKKCQHDMQQMKTLSDQSLVMLEKTHERITEELRNKHMKELDQLIADHRQELIEEKEATKQAIEALRKSHELDLQRYTEYNCDQQKSSQVHKPEVTGYDGCSEMLEGMRRELSQLSAAYSAKCLEMTDVEEELSETRAIIDQLCKGAQFEQLSVWEKTRHQAKTLEMSLKQKEEEAAHTTVYIQQLEDTLNICKKEMKSLECRIDDLSAQLETQQKIPTNHSVVTSFESTLIESNTDVSAAEYQPKTARNKRISPLARRNDFRFHSTPNLESTIVGQYPPDCGDSPNGERRMSEASLMDLRAAMGLPVAERRRYFETLGM